MQTSNGQIEPDTVTYNTVLKACCNADQLDKAMQVCCCSLAPQEAVFDKTSTVGLAEQHMMTCACSDSLHNIQVSNVAQKSAGAWQVLASAWHMLLSAWPRMQDRPTMSSMPCIRCHLTTVPPGFPRHDKMPDRVVHHHLWDSHDSWRKRTKLPIGQAGTACFLVHASNACMNCYVPHGSLQLL